MLVLQAKSTAKSKKEYTYNMGAINQAFNQAAGSVAAAATLIKGAKEKKLEQKEKDMSQALLGKEQYYEAEADIKDLTDQLT